MSWRDRKYDDDPGRGMGRPGGDWQGVRPTFDNPMSWSVPLGRAFGIDVRVHVIFLIYIVIELAKSFTLESGDQFSFGLVAIEMAALFVIVLLHEFGHCFACRRVGGSANEILMWPLGGLAYCAPPNRWRAHLVTVVGGPMVNVLLFLPVATVLTLASGHFWGVAFPNPFDFLAGWIPLQVEGASWWLLALYAVHYLNLLLLLFNLLPIFPLDGGRICQSLLWPRFGYVDSMRYSVYVGYIGAIGLGIFGAVVREWMLVGIAIFGGITCYMTLKQLQWTESFMQDEDDVYAAAHWSESEMREERVAPAAPKRAERREARRAERAQAESQRLDEILEKIAREGMDSLTGSERRVLRQATEQKRRDRGDDLGH